MGTTQSGKLMGMRWGDGAGSNKEGKAVAVNVAEVQNIARHVLKDRTGAVPVTEAVRAAVDPAVQLGRSLAREAT
jgi:hypothetical protein